MLSPKTRKFFLRLISNWPAKVLSIALALVLVLIYRVSMLSTRTLTVPLTVETNYTLIPASHFPASVRVTLRGESDGISSITENDIEAFIDMAKNEEEGSYRSPVQIRRRGNAVGLEPLEISVNPVEVSIDLDRRTNAVLPLVTPVQGTVASGFDLVSHSANPAEVSVSGPVGLMENISELATSPVNLEGRNSDFSVTVTIVNPDPLLSVSGSGIAEFSGTIRPTVPVRTIEGLPITVSSLSPDFAIDTPNRTGSVRIEGNWSQLDTFRPQPGFLSVDASGITRPGTYVLPVTVNLPNGFILIRQDPVNLSLTVRVKTAGDETDAENTAENRTDAPDVPVPEEAPQEENPTAETEQDEEAQSDLQTGDAPL